MLLFNFIYFLLFQYPYLFLFVYSLYLPLVVNCFASLYCLYLFSFSISGGRVPVRVVQLYVRRHGAEGTISNMAELHAKNRGSILIVFGAGGGERGARMNSFGFLSSLNSDYFQLNWVMSWNKEKKPNWYIISKILNWSN